VAGRLPGGDLLSPLAADPGDVLLAVPAPVIDQHRGVLPPQPTATSGQPGAPCSESSFRAAPEGTGTFKIEANVKLLMYLTTLATKLTGQGWQLYDQRCRPPF
jgi:hypothetical protein